MLIKLCLWLKAFLLKILQCCSLRASQIFMMMPLYLKAMGGAKKNAKRKALYITRRSKS